MSFSKEWDQRYIDNTHMSVWPWSDLVSLVRRHCKDLRGESRVLELGCGAGANIPFFQSMGVQYSAVEGSPSVVKLLHERFSDLAQRIVVGDFTQIQPFEPGFDLVVDRGSLTCNCTRDIESGLHLAWLALKPGGYFIGVDFLSVNHTEFLRGEADEDEYTRTNYEDGPLAGIGRAHFSDEAHLRKLFSRFELAYLEEKLLRRVVPDALWRPAYWNLAAKKPYSGGQPTVDDLGGFN